LPLLLGHHGLVPKVDLLKKYVSSGKWLEDFAALSAAIGRPVGTGEFGADMKVALVNDGPVTICIDTKNKE